MCARGAVLGACAPVCLRARASVCGRAGRVGGACGRVRVRARVRARVDTERDRRCEICAERLLDDDPPVALRVSRRYPCMCPAGIPNVSRRYPCMSPTGIPECVAPVALHASRRYHCMCPAGIPGCAPPLGVLKGAKGTQGR